MELITLSTYLIEISGLIIFTTKERIGQAQNLSLACRPISYYELIKFNNKRFSFIMTHLGFRPVPLKICNK